MSRRPLFVRVSFVAKGKKLLFERQCNRDRLEPLLEVTFFASCVAFYEVSFPRYVTDPVVVICVRQCRRVQLKIISNFTG